MLNSQFLFCIWNYSFPFSNQNIFLHLIGIFSIWNIPLFMIGTFYFFWLEYFCFSNWENLPCSIFFPIQNFNCVISKIRYGTEFCSCLPSVPLFVQFSISILHLEFFFSLLILGICNFKSECSIFQNGTSIFGIGTFYFSKNVLNNPIISRHNKLDMSKLVFKNPVNSCQTDLQGIS